MGIISNSAIEKVEKTGTAIKNNELEDKRKQ